ncbi:lipid A Kdo2 1-phosphate O-methyltransferase [Oleiagrimonas citrea]|uniref:Lipid A phosphate methyltransferase n=1 Tax=Oleiagrimonas citrea TaxID=1665687 RepID=A0A846ZF10_9GAMM|nr:isoprenylcysteine carboxylmethyltransferase family protein [Oleiagrimonas citrea]NKZ37634.1 hypothetical protein [Oleiagrimonas citrea]
MNAPQDRPETRLERQGTWLFHRRSLVGVVLLPALVLAIWRPGWPADALAHRTLDALTLTGFCIALSGLLLRALTVSMVPADTSRRSTRQQSADKLNTRGMYSVVRHPLYVANAWTMTGFALATGSLWFMLLFQFAHALYIRRILACEDRFLSQTHGEAWRAWADRTPAFLPNPLRWRPNELRPSMRTVMRREYNSVFIVGLAFFVLQLSRGLLIDKLSALDWAHHNTFWIAALAIAAAIQVTLRTLKRRTRLLHVPGR